MSTANGLGSFLRTRRDLVKPADVGLPDGERRRVAGLRREEVAMLAGISPEYYLRLEQGRERQPSDQVLHSLACALQLNDDATEYLRNLARPTPPRQRRPRPERVDPRVGGLVDSWASTPAYVQGRRMNVLAANPLACALTPFFAPGVNLLTATFLEPDVRTLLRNWDTITATLVAWLRFTLGTETADPELVKIVGELSVGSQRFRSLWARQDVRQKTSGLALFDHPQVGPLDLHYRALLMPEMRQSIVVYQAEPGSKSEEGLRLLSTLAYHVA
jgi:transcriptional regulator with XRE-family HTH domain